MTWKRPMRARSLAVKVIMVAPASASTASVRWTRWCRRDRGQHRHLSVTETVWEFTKAAANGRPVTALILTDSGKPDESPLGIVVAEDLTRLSE